MRRNSKPLFWSFFAASFAVTVLGQALAQPIRSAKRYEQLELFAKVLSRIELLHVEPVDKALVEEAIRGMLRSLDPHSSLLDPQSYRLLKEDIEGRFGGVGVVVGIRDDVLTVIAPLPGTPAERAGIRSGDIIVGIDGKSTENMTIDEAVRIMRGPKGTSVLVHIFRSEENKTLELRLDREVIDVDSVQAQELGDGFVHLEVRSFKRGTTEEARAALLDLAPENKIQGLVLDLRGNPGGPLEEAISLSDLFLRRGRIVETRGRGGEVLEAFEASSGSFLEKVPVVVMIDGASASAAEIVAGALQDQGRALVVGMRSFGKGSVQSIFDLPHGYGMKLTVARYYTPAGRSIQAAGIEPDVVVESRVAPEPDEKALIFKDMKGEADLPGHLQAEPQIDSNRDKAPVGDYQLHMASQILRGLAHRARARDLFHND